MERTAVDTSIVVPALLAAHEHHQRALRVLVSAREAESGIIVPLGVLTEAYAVLTRLPPHARLAPEVAWRLLEHAFAERATIPALDGGEGWRMLGTLPSLGIYGGATYDAAILESAKRAGAKRLATFNLRDFERLDLEGVELLSP